MKKNLKRNTYMYNWITLLCTWNWYNLVTQLCFPKKLLLWGRKKRRGFQHFWKEVSIFFSRNLGKTLSHLVSKQPLWLRSLPWEALTMFQDGPVHKAGGLQGGGTSGSPRSWGPQSPSQVIPRASAGELRSSKQRIISWRNPTYCHNNAFKNQTLSRR